MYQPLPEILQGLTHVKPHHTGSPETDLISAMAQIITEELGSPAEAGPYGLRTYEDTYLKIEYHNLYRTARISIYLEGTTRPVYSCSGEVTRYNSGMWTTYLVEKAESAQAARGQIENTKKAKELDSHQAKFSPVDDEAVFSRILEQPGCLPARETPRAIIWENGHTDNSHTATRVMSGHAIRAIVERSGGPGPGTKWSVEIEAEANTDANTDLVGNFWSTLYYGSFATRGEAKAFCEKWLCRQEPDREDP